MTDAFYPFVGEGSASHPGRRVRDEDGEKPSSTMDDRVENPTRIAVFDDPAAAPRVVVVQPSDVRSYLEEITETVTRLAREQGGRIPFTVIREIVENLVHAYFTEPTISVLDGGNTIRFSDQGPGIREKEKALEYGTTSATEEMRQYIRGVGSGLPYVQQYLLDHDGHLSIEDNISSGVVVTVSMGEASSRMGAGKPDDPSSSRRPIHPTPGNGTYPPDPDAATPPPPHAGYPYVPYPGWPPQGMPWPYQAMPQPVLDEDSRRGVNQDHAVRTPSRTDETPGARGADSEQDIPVSRRGRMALSYLVEHEEVGPTELSSLHGSSLSTWTRELKRLEEQGLVRRVGQKRLLTDAGKKHLSSL